MMKSRFPKKFLAGALVALAAAAMSGLPSCVAEKLTDCPPRLIIRTDHEHTYRGATPMTGDRTTRTDLSEWYGSIDSVSVYVFDEDDRFVTLWTGDDYTVGEDYEVPLDELNLPEGIYTFVAWTNRGEKHCYHCNVLERVPGDHIDEFWLRTVVPEDLSMDEVLEHRHYGILERVFISNHLLKNTHSEYVIEIDPGVHKVNFAFNGIDPTGEDTFELTVYDKNSYHDFYNQSHTGLDEHSNTQTLTFGDTGEDTRAAGTRAEPETLSASMMLMQLQDDTGTRVELARVMSDGSRGEPFFSKDLVELIEMVRGDNVDFEHNLEFDLTLNFSNDGTTLVGAVLIIEGWTYRWNKVTPGK